MKKAWSFQILAKYDLIVTFFSWEYGLSIYKKKKAGDLFGIKGLGYDMGN